MAASAGQSSLGVSRASIRTAEQSTLPQGQGYTSVEIKVSFLPTVHSGDALTAVGTIVKPGRRVAFSQGEIRDAAGKATATATSTCLVFDLSA